MARAHLGYCQGNDTTATDATKGHLPGVHGNVLEVSLQSIALAFRALKASPATNWRASSCTIRAENEGTQETVRRLARWGASKGTKMIEDLIGDPGVRLR